MSVSSISSALSLSAFAESDAGGDTLTWSRPTDSTHSHKALDQAATAASTTLPVRVDALPLLPLHRQGHRTPPSHHPSPFAGRNLEEFR